MGRMDEGRTGGRNGTTPLPYLFLTKQPTQNKQVQPHPRPYNFYVRGGPVRLHAVDNCLLLHCLGEARLSFVYDVLDDAEAAAQQQLSDDATGAMAAVDPFCGGGPVAYHAVGAGAGKDGKGPVEEAFYNPRCAPLLACLLDLRHVFVL